MLGLDVATLVCVSWLQQNEHAAFVWPVRCNIIWKTLFSNILRLNELFSNIFTVNSNSFVMDTPIYNILTVILMLFFQLPGGYNKNNFYFIIFDPWEIQIKALPVGQKLDFQEAISVKKELKFQG